MNTVKMCRADEEEHLGRKMQLIGKLAAVIETSDYTLGEGLFALEHLKKYYESKGDLPDTMSIQEVARMGGILKL